MPERETQGLEDSVWGLGDLQAVSWEPEDSLQLAGLQLLSFPPLLPVGFSGLFSADLSLSTSPSSDSGPSCHHIVYVTPKSCPGIGLHLVTCPLCQNNSRRNNNSWYDGEN